MKDLININNELSSLLKIFIEQIAEKDSFEVAAWLKENDIKTANDIRLLQNYARRIFQLFRKQWMEDGYEDYWEARELTKKNFRRADAELSKILRALRDLRRQP
jgi:predicted nucleotidyltransferase